MTKPKDLAFIFKRLLLPALCLCLMAVVCMKPVESTVSYVTSLSATCVNTFTGEGQEGPEEPGKPVQTENPPTGDSSHAEWYGAVLLLSLVGAVITWRLGRKRDFI